MPVQIIMKKDRIKAKHLLLTVLAILIICYIFSFPKESCSSPPKRHAPIVIQKTTSGKVDLCLNCHSDEPDKYHARGVVSCSACHLGDPLTGDMTRAHRGMIKNPGDLRWVDKTCGRPGCHPKEVSWVKHSLMATNRGIISTLRYYWGEAKNQHENLTVEDLIKTGLDTKCLDYYRKMCGSCHLWFPKGKFPGFLSQKGGGCTACHDVAPKGGLGPGKHPLIISKIPMSNCLRCHNRSGRIGLAYNGELDADDYGTPFVSGGLNYFQLPDGRFLIHLPDDIHHRKGLICIDCHTQKEIMGNGKSHAHFEDQIEISCRLCHGLHRNLEPIVKAYKKKLEGYKPYPDTAPYGSQPLRLRIIKKDGKYFLKGIKDNKLHPLDKLDPTQCLAKVHKRLSCQACHSVWVAQCYGCHVRSDESKMQLDKLSDKLTPRRWEEFKSFVRWNSPPLGVLRNKIVDIVPGCQDFVSFINGAGRFTGTFDRLTIAWIDPHTTSKKGRSCKNCHEDPRSLGLGRGTLTATQKGWEFKPDLSNESKLLGIKYPLDEFVTINGKQLVHTSRRWLHTFNKNEIYRILNVGLCLPCHPGIKDPVMRKWMETGIRPKPCKYAPSVSKYLWKMTKEDNQNNSKRKRQKINGTGTNNTTRK